MKYPDAPKRWIACCTLACAVLMAGSAMGASPAQFVVEATEAGHAEIENSRLAITQSSSTDINSYAVEMIKDHTDANRELKAIAEKNNWPVATESEITDKIKKLLLEVQQGDSFDAAYVANQIKAHSEAIERFKAQARDPSSPELQAFAKQYLPKLELHLEMAKKLELTHHKGATGSSGQ